MPSRRVQCAVASALVMVFARGVALGAPSTTAGPVVAPPTNDESDDDRPVPSARRRALEAPEAPEAPEVTTRSSPSASPPPLSPAAVPVVAPPTASKAPIAARGDGDGCVGGFDANGAPCSTSVSTESPSRKPTAHLHDGFFFRAGLGASIYASSAPGAASRVRGGGVFELLFGGTPWPGVVIGGGVLAQTDETLLGYHAFLQYYPNPRTGFHIQGLVGVAISESDGAGGAGTGGSRTPVGPIAAGGVGYDFWSGAQTSFGVFARIGVTRISYPIIDVSTGSSTTTSDTVTSFGNIVGTFTFH